MRRLYQRRAFLLFALAALEPAGATAARAADGETLWDVLARTKSGPDTGSGIDPTVAASPPAIRQPLGPLPGFALPASINAAPASIIDAPKGKPKSSGMFGELGNWFNRLETQTGSKIKATGYQNFSFRMDSVSGGQTATQAYQSEQYYGQGSNGFYNDTDLTIDATLFKYFHYQTRISNSLFHNPNDNRVKLDYNTSKMRVQWGDINAGFQGNSLINFNLYLHGVELSNQWTPHLKTDVLYSQTKAETRTIVIPGNNSVGPYYVYAGQIVEGSDHVRVDNHDMVKGTDYTLDSFTGQLTFLRGNVILATSTIAVSFEALGFGGSQGTVYGFRSEYSPGHTTNFGLTYVTEQAPGSGTSQQRTDAMYGAGTNPVPGSPITPGAGPFYSTSAPIDPSRPVTVTVDGATLTPAQFSLAVSNTAYTNQVFINFLIPTTSTVKVTYYPYDATPVAGNRSVMGLDGRFGLGKLGSVSLESAFSGVSLTGNQVAGQALQVRADLNPFRNFHSNLTLRDISPSFSSIASPGFNQNEKSISFTSDYNPFKNLKLNMTWELAHRPDYSTGSTVTATSVTPIGTDVYNQYGLGLNYKFARNASLSLTRNSLNTTYFLGGFSRNVSDSLALDYSLHRVSLEAALSQTQSNVDSSYSLLGLAATSTGASQVVTTDSSTLSKRLSIRWQATNWLNFNGAISDNSITNTGSTQLGSLDARDTQITANFTRIRNVRLSYSYDLSDTGNNTTTTPTTTPTSTTTTTPASTATTSTPSTPTIGGTSIRAVFARAFGLLTGARDLTAGTTTPTSTTTGTTLGTLFGGGVNTNLGGLGNYSGALGNTFISGYGLSSYGGKSATQRVALDYTPRPGMQVGVQFDTANSNGDYQYNSDRVDFGFNFGWQVSQRFQLTGTYGVQRVAYVGQVGNSNSTTLLLALQGRPFGGKLTTQFSWQSLITSSALSTVATATTAAATAAATNTSVNLNSLSLRLEYPLSRRESVFFDGLLSNSVGYYGSKEENLQFGFDFAITQPLKFSLGWQIQSHVYADAANANLNYHVSTLLAQFGLHF